MVNKNKSFFFKKTNTIAKFTVKQEEKKKKNKQKRRGSIDYSDWHQKWNISTHFKKRSQEDITGSSSKFKIWI